MAGVKVIELLGESEERPSRNWGPQAAVRNGRRVHRSATAWSLGSGPPGSGRPLPLGVGRAPPAPAWSPVGGPPVPGRPLPLRFDRTTKPLRRSGQRTGQATLARILVSRL